MCRKKLRGRKVGREEMVRGRKVGREVKVRGRKVGREEKVRGRKVGRKEEVRARRTLNIHLSLLNHRSQLQYSTDLQFTFIHKL